MIKAILFDIDGVLTDSFESNYKFFSQIFKVANLPPITKQWYKKAFHLSMRDVIKAHLPDLKPKQVEALAKIGADLFKERDRVKLMPGSTAVVKKLSKKYNMALVTGRTTHGVYEYLDQTKLHDIFKTISHFGMYKNTKPHPEPLLLALKKLKIKPNEAVYIGDAETDILAAKAAKMKIILYNKKRIKGADIRVENLADLPKAITRLENMK